jgi:hypothetical protein
MKNFLIVWPLFFFAGSVLASSEYIGGLNDGGSSAQLPDSPAREYFKLLSQRPSNGPASKKGGNSESTVQSFSSNQSSEKHQTIPRITVYGRFDPEDYVAPKPPTMLVFRAALDRQRPKTPKEITQAVLCFVSLCAIDTSQELSIADRNELRAKSPPSFAGLP